MKVFAFSGADSPLVEREIPFPQPGAGEVLVKVHAAGVAPTELLWSTTTHTKAGGAREYAVPGHEFSGVIVALGERSRSVSARRRGLRDERLVGRRGHGGVLHR